MGPPEGVEVFDLPAASRFPERSIASIRKSGPKSGASATERGHFSRFAGQADKDPMGAGAAQGPAPGIERRRAAKKAPERPKCAGRQRLESAPKK